MGCSQDRAAVTDPFGPPAYNFRLSKVGTNLPHGTVDVTAPATDSTGIKVTLQGLEPLTSGVYQLWLGSQTDSAASGFVKAVGSLVVARTDTTVNAAGDPVFRTDTTLRQSNVSSFTIGGAKLTIIVNITKLSLGSDPLAKNLLLVTVEDNASATTPGASRPLWRSFSTTTSSSGPLNFGTFNAKPDSAYVFVLSGRGTASVFGGILVLDDSALSRPPVGYYYAVFAVKRDSVGKAVDTLALGAQTAPYPNRSQSLRDADITLIPGVVIASPPEILAAANRIKSDTIPRLDKATPYAGFTDLIITLQHKKGAGTIASPAIALSAIFPGVVTKPPSP
ncbi:MAG: hypothetical protein M3Z10_10030 [Gemmatimonadota bacterium]|nr:hypothetical protein [Gemmatimonadota bacterium]